MNRLLSQILIFLSGLLVGTAAMAWFIHVGPAAVVRMQWEAGARERTVYATLLQEQKYADLEKLLETNLSASLLGMKALGFDTEFKGTVPMVKGFYDFSGRPIPSQLAPSLAGVKGSDPRKLADLMAAHADQVDWSPRE